MLSSCNCFLLVVFQLKLNVTQGDFVFLNVKLVIQGDIVATHISRK